MSAVAADRAASHYVPRLPEGHLDMGGDASDLPVVANDVADYRVVPAVLQRHEKPLGLDVSFHEVGGPLGVVGLYRDYGVVKRLVYSLGVGQVHGFYWNRKISLAATSPKSLFSHRLDVFWPHVDERHVFACLGYEGTDVAAQSSRTDDSNPVAHQIILHSPISANHTKAGSFSEQVQIFGLTVLNPVNEKTP